VPRPASSPARATAKVPELRIDPLTGLRTILAAARVDRPGGGFSVPERPPIDPARDPFLEGHEDRTPPELYALRDGGGGADTPGWRVRVVPNLYPALTPASEGGRGSGEVSESGEGRGGPEKSAGGPGKSTGSAGKSAGSADDPLSAGRGEPDLFPTRPAVGAHEVIVNAPEAVTSLSALDPGQVATAMGVWRDRIVCHEGAAYVHLIVNEGKQAGASLPHTHAQLYALSFVPAAIARERERFSAYAERTQGRNLLEDLLQEEVRLGERIVALDGEAVAICPFASRVPFQLQIAPRTPRARFEDPGPLAAALLHEVLRRLERVLGGPPPLNMWVRTAPSGAADFCWRIDIVPRLTELAGLELGVGLNLNVLAPERAAAILRDSGGGEPAGIAQAAGAR